MGNPNICAGSVASASGFYLVTGVVLCCHINRVYKVLQ